MANSATLDAALGYAKRRWATFPCRPKLKVPATKNGFEDASSDPAVIEKLFAGKDGYNLAVATGKTSGFWALDLDPGHDDDTEFVKLLRDNGGLPATFRQSTPRGGQHYFFRCNGEEIKNRTKIGGEAVDVRGEGGYILISPSKTKDGEYSIVDKNAKILDAPEWLIRYVTGDNSLSSRL